MWDHNILSIFDTKHYTTESKEDYVGLSLNSHDPIPLGKNGYGFIGGNPDGTWLDKNHKYIINKLGYRGKEFKNKSDVLFAGCSQTFGLGIPEEMIWGNQLGVLLNKDVANISRPGASVQWIVQKIFAYCQKFGNPEIIVCLFPDFFRLLIPKNNINVNDNNILSSLILENHFFTQPQYSKKPHKLENILDLNIPLYFAIQYVHILEQYCKSNNIKLHWSTWHEKTADIINLLYKQYNNFIYYNEASVYKDFKLFCHKEISERYPHCFHRGTDIELSEDSAHIGVHSHTHIAEYFYKLIQGETC
jgi:hypothetical protein